MLNASEIRKLIETRQLITGYIDLEKQLQPSGFDLSLSEVQTFSGVGTVDFSNMERTIAPTTTLQLDSEGWYTLNRDCYLIMYNEVVKMPLDLVAIGRPRSTLLRNGVTMETAVWDPGYHGKGLSLLLVHNPSGVRLKRDARLTQLLFFRIDEVEEGYRGVYQHERLKTEQR